jgi:hypothetical protein
VWAIAELSGCGGSPRGKGPSFMGTAPSEDLAGCGCSMRQALAAAVEVVPSVGTVKCYSANIVQ